MAINIKNPRAVDAIKRLAVHYDVNYTTAIEMAATAALRTPDPSRQDEAVRRVGRIAAEYRAHLPRATTLDSDELYDETGVYR